jgi:sec-independent protein translocase protein TatC
VTSAPEDEIEQSQAPLLDHIIELRNRLMWSVGALAIAFVVCYIFAEEIYTFLMQPLMQAMGENSVHRRMIFTALHEAFFTYIKVAFFAGMMLAFPVIASQVWMFIAPGLYKNEKRAFLPFLAATPVLFLCGAALVYYLIMPLAWNFFLSFETPGSQGALPIELESKVSEYLSLTMTLIFAFGLCFELPVLLTLMGRVGLTSSEGLKSKRKFAIVGVFIAAALLTPPDPISQISLALPILLLYEISIIAVRMVEKKRAEREAAEE